MSGEWVSLGVREAFKTTFGGAPSGSEGVTTGPATLGAIQAGRTALGGVSPCHPPSPHLSTPCIPE